MQEKPNVIVGLKSWAATIQPFNKYINWKQNKKPCKVNYKKICSRRECQFTKNDAIVVSLSTYIVQMLQNSICNMVPSFANTYNIYLLHLYEREKDLHYVH